MRSLSLWLSSLVFSILKFWLPASSTSFSCCAIVLSSFAFCVASSASSFSIVTFCNSCFFTETSSPSCATTEDISRFWLSNSATSLARSFFSNSSTDKCFSCVPFCSHSTPYCSMTVASFFFSDAIHWFNSVAPLVPPVKPSAASADFNDTLVSSPRLLPVIYGTKSMCRCGVSSSICKCAENTYKFGFLSWNSSINSVKILFANNPSSLLAFISSLFPIWNITSWNNFSCLPLLIFS